MMTFKKLIGIAFVAVFASVASATENSTHVQIITYTIVGISADEYQQQMVKPDAIAIAKVDGLISKTWLANEETNRYGGFYLWENKTAMENFMNSELVKAVVSRSFVKDVESVDYSINVSPSKVTRGLK